MLKYCKNRYFENGIWYSKSKVYYPDQGNDIYMSIEDESFWYKHRNDCIAIIANRFFRKDERIFDIGGGNGFVSKRLQEEGFDPYLLEPDSIGIKNAQKRGIKNLICSSFLDAEVIEESIPNIGLFDVLEHIENDSMFLLSMVESLEKGGKIIVTVPAYSFLWSDEDNHDGHKRRYRRKKLESKFNEAGLTTLYSSYFFSLLPIPIFLLRTIPSFFKKKRLFTKEEYLKENKTESNLLNSIMSIIWQNEYKRFLNKKSIAFGGSIIIVAQKN